MSSRFYEGVPGGDFRQHSWDSVLRGRCSETRETTHVMVQGIRGLPNWVNEGPAVYLSHRDRSNWCIQPDLMRCEETG